MRDVTVELNGLCKPTEQCRLLVEENDGSSRGRSRRCLDASEPAMSASKGTQWLLKFEVIFKVVEVREL